MNCAQYKAVYLSCSRQRSTAAGSFALCALRFAASRFTFLSYRQVYVQGYKLSCHGVHIWVGSSLYSFRMHSSVVFIWDLERGQDLQVQVHAVLLRGSTTP
eukprot:scaffold90296_cov68-Phaeocystis_antarctica.AAC.5